METTKILMIDPKEREKNSKLLYGNSARGRKGMSEEKKNHIVEMYNQGYRIKDIQENLSVSAPTIYKILKERTPAKPQ